MGEKAIIEAIAAEFELNLEGLEILNPKDHSCDELVERFALKYYEDRKRKGVTLYDARKIMRERNYFGSMLVKEGIADALLSGLTRSYAEVLRPALRVMGTEANTKKVAGMYVVLSKDKPYFFADTTVNLNPTVDDIVEIAVLSHQTVKKFGIEPSLALLSYSNFGSAGGVDAEKMQKAKAILSRDYPEITVDGDIRANFALNEELLTEIFPFSDLVGKKANTFIFPNLSAGNIAYKLMDELAGLETIGPILMGMKKSVHVLTHGGSVKDIVNMATIAVMDARFKQKA